jgi:hypothetical protein
MVALASARLSISAISIYRQSRGLMKSEFEKVSLRIRAQNYITLGQGTREPTLLDLAAIPANENDPRVDTEGARFALAHTPTGAKILAWNIGD